MSRPHILGILFTPKLNPSINMDTKDAWDFVLRKCFLREAIPLESAINSLGFGAGSLLEKIREDSRRYRGRAVSEKKVVRDLEVEEWERVVDVFDKWAFRPEVCCERERERERVHCKLSVVKDIG